MWLVFSRGSTYLCVEGFRSRWQSWSECNQVVSHYISSLEKSTVSETHLKQPFLQISPSHQFQTTPQNFEQSTRTRGVSIEIFNRSIIVPSADSRSLKDVCKAQLFRPQFIANIIFSEIEVWFPHKQIRYQVPFPREFTPLDFESWVTLPEALFYCAGEEGQWHFVNVCFLLPIPPTSAKKLPKMISPRAKRGLVYFDGSVYAFGGVTVYTEDDVTLQTECEKFTLATNKWSQLPPMRTKRENVAPARLYSSIYLAGGTSDRSVEVFSLISETFQANVSLKLCLSDIYSTVFALNNTLVVLAEEYVCQYDVKVETLIRKERLTCDTEQSNPGEAAEFDGKVYFLLNQQFATMSEDLLLELP